MKIEKDGKTLYHVQSLMEYKYYPIDLFLYADHYPTEAECRQAFIDEDYEDWIDNIMDNYEVYTLYAEEL